MTAPIARAAAWAVVIALLGLLPLLASDFFVSQIATKALWLGLIAASLTFLSAYGGMISLAQTAIAGSAAFTIANLTVLHGWPVGRAVAVAVAFSTMLALIIGALTAQVYGVYYFMVTLAVGVFLYFYAFQAQDFTGGFNGINGIPRPVLFGISFDAPTNFYALTFVMSVSAYVLLKYVSRSPFGVALQGTRDQHERSGALGFSIFALRVAAFTLAGFVAATGGVLQAWYNGSISPGSIDFARIVEVVVAVVIGGILHLEGAWIGAFIVVILGNYVSDYTPRYNTAIGLVFVGVVLLFPEGVAGVIPRLMRSTAGQAGRGPLSAVRRRLRAVGPERQGGDCG